MCAKNPESQPLRFDMIISKLRAFGKAYEVKDPAIPFVLNVFADEMTTSAQCVADHIKTQQAILQNAYLRLNEAEAKLTAIAKLVEELAAENKGGEGGAA